MPKHTDSSLIKLVSQKTQVPSIYAEQLLEVLGDAVSELLSKKKEVKIGGLGCFRRDDIRKKPRIIFSAQQSLLAPTQPGSFDHSENK